MRPPGALVFVGGLLALGFAAAAASLAVQRLETQRTAQVAARELTGGDPVRGKATFTAYGCGACHSIRGVAQADGKVGPPLDGIAARGFVAGREPNAPERMIAWVRHPQDLQPGSGMPDVGLSQAQARDVAAYLYTLR
jgi:cytochrome c2